MNREERTAAARTAISKAHVKGFLDCKAIVRLLYPERFPENPVRWEAAYRWLADAGVAVVYLVPDGDTDVPKAERTGCWSVNFTVVLAYKEAYYKQIAVNDWIRNVEGAMDTGLDREEAEEMMGLRPTAPNFFVDTAWKATGTKARNSSPQETETQDGQILVAMRNWSGRVNKKGKPKPSALSAVVGFIVTRERRNRLWAIIEAERA